MKSGCTSVKLLYYCRIYCSKCPKILGDIARRNLQAQPFPLKALFHCDLPLDSSRQIDESSLNNVLVFQLSVSTFLYLNSSFCLYNAAHTTMCFYEEGFLNNNNFVN